MPRLALLVVALILSTTIVWAAEITVSDAWIRRLPVDVPSAGYFTVHNQGDRLVGLVRAHSSVYGMIMMHQTIAKGGMSKMVKVQRIDIAPGGTVSFHPRSYHLMLMDPKREIAIGSKVPVTLEFSGGQKVTAQFEVRGAAAR